MATDLDTTRTQYDNYRYCNDNGHSDWLELAQQCFNYWRSKQWDERVKAQLEREGRPALTFNIIESLVRAMKGMQRALRNDVRFTPVQGTDAESARVQDAIWLHIQNQNQLDFIETDLYEKGLITGRAYYDVRVSYDESIQGDVIIKTRRSQDIILDPSADQYDPKEWPQVLDRRWVSYDDIEHMLGKEKADAAFHNGTPDYYDVEDIEHGRALGRMPYYSMDGMVDSKKVRGMLLLGRQYYVNKEKEMFVDLKTGDMSEIPETWDRERVGRVIELASQRGTRISTMKRKVKTVRWTVTCDNALMHDDDSPYKNFNIVPFFPTFVDGVSMGAVESLIDPQQLFNKMTSQELHIISTTANSGYKLLTGALVGMTRQELERDGAKAGFVAELTRMDGLEKIQPNQVPAGHDHLSDKADRIMRQIAGTPDGGRGFSRDDASQDKVLQDQAGQAVNFAAWLANLHRTKQLLASRVLDCVQAHYDSEREIMITQGSVYKPQVQSIQINDGSYVNDVSRGKYSTVLVPAPSRTTMSKEDFDLMIKLRTEVGIQIPDDLLIELCPASNKAQLVQALQGDSNERQKAAEELAQQQAQVELQKGQAAVEKEQSAAQLNAARAQKFTVEAQSDPDASYERVEQERIASDRTAEENRIALEDRKLAQKEKNDRRMLALSLTKIHSDETTKREAIKAKPAPTPAAKAKPKAKPPARKR